MCIYIYIWDIIPVYPVGIPLGRPCGFSHQPLWGLLTKKYGDQKGDLKWSQGRLYDFISNKYGDFSAVNSRNKLGIKLSLFGCKTLRDLKWRIQNFAFGIGDIISNFIGKCMAAGAANDILAVVECCTNCSCCTDSRVTCIIAVR